MVVGPVLVFAAVAEAFVFAGECEVLVREVRGLAVVEPPAVVLGLRDVAGFAVGRREGWVKACVGYSWAPAGRRKVVGADAVLLPVQEPGW